MTSTKTVALRIAAAVALNVLTFTAVQAQGFYMGGSVATTVPIYGSQVAVQIDHNHRTNGVVINNDHRTNGVVINNDH